MSPMIMRNEPPTFVGRRPTSRVIARSWPDVDRSADRPGYQLTPERLWQAYRIADMGSPATQCGIFEDLIESDGHTRGQYLQRMKAAAQRDFDILPGGSDPIDIACAESLRADLVGTNIDEILWHMLESVFYGYAGAQTVWDLVEGRIAPRWFIEIEHKRFAFDQSNYPRLRTQTDPYPGIPLTGPMGQWWFAHQPHRLIQRAGIMRTVAWWCTFKRMSVRDWMVFAEKFGLPIVLGQHKELASDATRRALMQAIEDVGRDGQAMLSDTCQIVVKDASMRGGDISSLHPAVIQMCNSEISKLITGATLTTETGGPGSFALGKVHENRSTHLNFADARFIKRSFARWVAQPYTVHNEQFKRAKPPELWIYVQPEMDPLTEVQVDDKLQQMGYQLDRDDLGRRYGRRWAEGDRVLSRPQFEIDREKAKAASATPAPRQPRA